MTKDEALNLALEALGDIASARSSGFGIDYAEGYATTTIKQLRQALAEPDTGIDRGAWSEVPDATKWVDDLRGDEDLEESPNSATNVVEPIGEIVEAHGLIGVSIPTMPPAGTKLYASPPQREWVGLTYAEIDHIWGITPPDYVDKFALPRMIEAKLKELNNA